MNNQLNLPKFGYMKGIEFADGEKTFVDYIQPKPLTKKDLAITAKQRKIGLIRTWQIKLEIKEVGHE